MFRKIPDIEALNKVNRELEEVIVKFEDGANIAVNRNLFDEHPEDVWKSINRLHDRWTAKHAK